MNIIVSMVIHHQSTSIMVPVCNSDATYGKRHRIPAKFHDQTPFDPNPNHKEFEFEAHSTSFNLMEEYISSDFPDLATDSNDNN